MATIKEIGQILWAAEGCYVEAESFRKREIKSVAVLMLDRSQQYLNVAKYLVKNK